MKTLVVVNPYASSGKAVRHYQGLTSELREAFGEYELIVSRTIDEVHQAVARVAEGGPWRVVVVGGDGTNHVVINALASYPNADVVFGGLPVGTGQDWARTLDVPGSLKERVRWLAEAHPIPCDLGRLSYTEKGQARERFFLNIASAGISGDVDERVNAARVKRPWTFLLATIGTLLWYQPEVMQIVVDGQTLYNGTCYILAVANGRYFGHGMMVAPHAEIDDGLFDIVIVEGMSRVEALQALPTIFSGEHIKRPDVHIGRGRRVEVHLPPEASPIIGLDMDGEYARGQDLTFEVLPGALKLLAHPTD